jgi:hypothetical protein
LSLCGYFSPPHEQLLIKTLNAMSQLVFQESELIFHFDGRWVVKKYDAHRYFSGLAGQGLKGVDFIAISEDTILLIEIKNYRRRHSWQKENPFAQVEEAPDAFVDKIVDKADDTLRGIRAIGQYYYRKWWFALMRPFLSRLSPAKHESVFWIRAYQLISAKENITFILWLETEQPQEGIRRQILGQLQHQLSSLVSRAEISSCNHHHLSNYFTASRVEEEAQ